MSVSGIGTAGYPVAEYQTRKTERVALKKQFSDVVFEKVIAKKMM